jgi:hypothetical protein
MLSSLNFYIKLGMKKSSLKNSFALIWWIIAITFFIISFNIKYSYPPSFSWIPWHPSVIIMILILSWTLVDMILNSQIEKERKKREFELQEKHKNFVDDLKEKHNELLKKLISAQKDQELWKTCLKERASGFPTLMNILQQREEYLDSLMPHYLETKPHPAYSAAEAIKITNRLKILPQLFLKWREHSQKHLILN